MSLSCRLCALPPAPVVATDCRTPADRRERRPVHDVHLLLLATILLVLAASLSAATWLSDRRSALADGAPLLVNSCWQERADGLRTAPTVRSGDGLSTTSTEGARSTRTAA